MRFCRFLANQSGSRVESVRIEARGNECDRHRGVRMSAFGHKRDIPTLIRHVRFSTETRPRDAIG